MAIFAELLLRCACQNRISHVEIQYWHYFAECFPSSQVSLLFVRLHCVFAGCSNIPSIHTHHPAACPPCRPMLLYRFLPCNIDSNKTKLRTRNEPASFPLNSEQPWMQERESKQNSYRQFSLLRLALPAGSCVQRCGVKSRFGVLPQRALFLLP